MRNKRAKETNRHIKKYNRIKIFGSIIYYLCLVATFSYWLYIILLWLMYSNENITQFPLTDTWTRVIFTALPFISIVEYLYEKLLQFRAMNVLINRQKRAELHKLHN